MDIENLRYPIGQFEKPEIITQEQIKQWIVEIELFPTRLSNLVKALTNEQLNRQYKPNGWTIKQLVHHCADSHMNSFIRFKLSLTEDTPTIKPYAEDKWAELPDAKDSSISESLQILEGLHSRWAVLLKSLSDGDLQREFIHPEHNKKFSIAENIGVYAWHCNHHLEHIKLAINR